MGKRNFQIRDDNTIYEMMRLHSNLAGQFQPIVEQMTKLFDFTVAELQWDKDVRERLRNEARPANSYNLIRTILNVIFSVERENRRRGKASPRTGGDNELAQTITQVLHYYLYHAKFTRVQKTVFMDSIIAILGVYYVNFSFKNNPEGMLEIEACDPREFMYEPNFDDPCWSKSSFVLRKHELSIEEILNQFALNDQEMQNEILFEAKAFFEQDMGKRDKWVSKKLKALFTAVYETATGYAPSDSGQKSFLQWWDPTSGKFDVLELHEKRTERILLIPDNEGTKLFDITDHTREDDGISFNYQKIEMVRQHMGLTGEPHVDIANKRFITAVVPAFRIKLNEQPYPFASDYYVYIPQQCYDLHANPLKAQSVISDLVDPQAHFNKAQSLKLELLGRYANKGWIMDENAISGLEGDWATNRIAPYRRVRAGYINMIRPEEGQTISPDLVRDPLETQQLMKVISNADDEIRGNANSEVKSGKHFIAKEQRQSKSYSYIFDNRDLTQVAVYELALNFIQHFVKAQTIIRITKDISPDVNTPTEITLNQTSFEFDPDKGGIVTKIVNDLDAVKFDIELSDEPYSSTAQQERYFKLAELFNAALEVNPKKADALLPFLLKLGNYPEAEDIMQAWKQLDAPDPMQTEFQKVMLQLQMITAKLGIEEKKEDIKSKKLDNLSKGQEIKQGSKSNVLGTTHKIKKSKPQDALKVMNF